MTVFGPCGFLLLMSGWCLSVSGDDGESQNTAGFGWVYRDLRLVICENPLLALPVDSKGKYKLIQLVKGSAARANIRIHRGFSP